VEKPSISEPSPPSPTRWPADAFAWPRSLTIVAALAAAFLTGQALAAFIIAHSGTTLRDLRTEHLTWGILIAQFATYLPLLVVLWFGLPWLSGGSFSSLGLRGFDRKTLGAGLLGAVAMYAATIGVAQIQYALTRQKPEEAATSLFASAHDPALLISFSLLAVIVAPFMEELIFRGFAFNALARYAPVWAAALLSGLLFGYAHVVSQPSISAFLPLAASGIVLAYVYQRSGSLTASMLTHGLFNLVNVVLITVKVS
jgi:membrane protease YdiL (CAAX protease family)